MLSRGLSKNVLICGEIWFGKRTAGAEYLLEYPVSHFVDTTGHCRSGGRSLMNVGGNRLKV